MAAEAAPPTSAASKEPTVPTPAVIVEDIPTPMVAGEKQAEQKEANSEKPKKRGGSNFVGCRFWVFSIVESTTFKTRKL